MCLLFYFPQLKHFFPVEKIHYKKNTHNQTIIIILQFVLVQPWFCTDLQMKTCANPQNFHSIIFFFFPQNTPILCDGYQVKAVSDITAESVELEQNDDRISASLAPKRLMLHFHSKSKEKTFYTSFLSKRVCIHMSLQSNQVTIKNITKKKQRVDFSVADYSTHRNGGCPLQCIR